MSFLSPLFLFGLLALGVPLALHLIRRRVVRTVPFPALRFLAATRADERKHRLRRRVVLALRCLALALLAFAFARPFFGSPPADSGRATVLVVDNSFSLQAAGRWPAVLRWARDQLGPVRDGDTLGLLLMNPRPSWLVAPTRDTAATLAALDALAPGWESTRAEPALRLAGDMLAVTPARERRILFLGDHQAQGWLGADFAKPLPPGVALAFPPPAPAPANQAALLSASLTRSGETWQLAVSARRHAGAAPRTVSVFAEDSPSPLLSAPVSFDADGAATLRTALPAFSDEIAWLRLALDTDDLPADDTLWLAAPARTHGDRVLLLDRPASSSATDYLATAYQSLSALPPSLRLSPPPTTTAWPTHAVAVLRNDASFSSESGARLDAFLASGGSALVFFTDGPAQKKWLTAHGLSLHPLKLNPQTSTASSSKTARLRDWTLDHPLVAPLAEQNFRALIGWEFARASALPADSVEPLALWDDGTVALGEFSAGSGRVLLAGWTPDRAHGEWPLSPAFLPFLHQAAAHLAGLAAASASSPPRVGVPVTTPAPGLWRLVSGPAKAPAPPATPASTFMPRAPGLYEFAASGSPARLLAVGLAPEESDLAPWPDGTPWLGLASKDKAPAVEAEHRPVASPSFDGENRNPLWWWALAAMAVFALAELALANRTAR